MAIEPDRRAGSPGGWPGGGAAHNPFSSERVRPGTVAMTMPDGVTIASLFAEFLETGARGQLLGAHGTGKSTLLHHLAAHARELGWRVESVAPGQPAKPMATHGRRHLLVVDGADLLPRREWSRLDRRCVRTEAALLITTHADLGLPWTWTTHVTPEALDCLVRRLLSGWHVQPPPTAMLAELLDEHQGNARLVLFALYDWYEGLTS